jgi:hypothetical protein
LIRAHPFDDLHREPNERHNSDCNDEDDSDDDKCFAIERGASTAIASSAASFEKRSESESASARFCKLFGTASCRWFTPNFVQEFEPSRAVSKFDDAMFPPAVARFFWTEQRAAIDAYVRARKRGMRGASRFIGGRTF